MQLIRLIATPSYGMGQESVTKSIKANTVNYVFLSVSRISKRFHVDQ